MIGRKKEIALLLKAAESGKDGPCRVQKGKRGGRRSKRRQERNIQS